MPDTQSEVDSRRSACDLAARMSEPSGSSGSPTDGSSDERTDRAASWAWALYDWANSAFATTVLAGFFPIFFRLYWSAGAEGNLPSLRLGLANTIGSIVVVLVAPILGAVADCGGLRKKMLAAFAAMGALATGGLWLVGQGQWQLAVGLFVVGNLGFMGGNVFYDALLVNVAPPRHRDFVSGLGYALGYLGGGLLFAIQVASVLNPSAFGFADAAAATRVAFLTVAGWWVLFSVPLFLFVKEPARRSDPRRAVRDGVQRLGETIRLLRDRQLRIVATFLVAYWLYIDGIDTIIRMGLDFGLAVGLKQADLIKALLMVQFVGFPAALVFGKLGARIGAKKGVLIGVAAYVLVTVVATFITKERPWLFFVLAGGIGLFQGGVQALSRSLFTRLIPKHKATELFGFYNMLGKFAAVLGPSLVGVVSVVTGEPRFSILAVLVFLVPGGLLLLRVDVARGEEIARDLEASA